jgi:hypothetical protein
MPKILVDKDELKGLRDNIDYLLETGKQSFVISSQQPIYDSYDLEERERLIIEYLNKNPGSTKEQVVNGLKKNYSRIPIIHTINSLLLLLPLSIIVTIPYISDLYTIIDWATFHTVFL